ncbi:MAG: EFR1 family ferrodoxin [Eubacteriales bacterium]
MTTKIFYFSGTGNSLAVAKAIAKQINADLISIPDAMSADVVSVSAEQIGIVFPCYLTGTVGLAPMVLKFVQCIPALSKHTVFAVCTCGGYPSVNALPSLQILQKAIHGAGGHCRAAYSVRMPMNNLDYDHIPIPIEKDTRKILSKSSRVIRRICKRIENNKKTRFPALKRLFLWLMQPVFSLMPPLIITALRKQAKTETLDLSVYDLIPLTDKSIVVNDSCTGCGICAKVCPASNISLIDGRPVFHHTCEMCFACDEWCPTSAIQHWGRKEHVKYHHPDITLENMIK